MKTSPNHSTAKNYYTGGAAQIVDTPTPLTFSFLRHWFLGSQSYGHAMNVLGIPCQAVDESLLVLEDGDLLVNLAADERILYDQTLFAYKKQITPDDIPALRVDIKKLLSPPCVLNTLKLILIQSAWVAYPTTIVKKMETLVDAIDTAHTTLPIAKLDHYVTETVLPAVIAVGFVSEYFHQYCTQSIGSSKEIAEAYITANVAKDDWIFQSVSDQYRVKIRERSFEWYIDTYGMRADRDFELTSPRWKEMPDIIRERISQSQPFPGTNTTITLPAQYKQLADAVVSLQILRTRVKQTALLFIDAIRTHIRIHTQEMPSFGHLSRELILRGEYPAPDSAPKKKLIPRKTAPLHTSGKGTAVSAGTCTGNVIHITDIQASIPENAIGVFPNASPEFSILFTKCIGLIFARGGQTSHGAIVAREFGIPAIIEKSASAIPNGARISLHGTDGTWRVV